MEKVDFNGEGQIDNSIIKFKGEQQIVDNKIVDKNLWEVFLKDQISKNFS